MDAARQQQAMEGQAMRRRAIQQQAQVAPTQEQGVAPEFAPQVPMGRPGMGGRPEMGGRPGMGGRPEMGGMPGMGGRPEMGGRPGMGGMPGMGGRPEIPSGINFGPGRANRTPEQGSPEYEQLLQRVRGLNQKRR